MVSLDGAMSELCNLLKPGTESMRNIRDKCEFALSAFNARVSKVALLPRVIKDQSIEKATEGIYLLKDYNTMLINRARMALEAVILGYCATQIIACVEKAVIFIDDKTTSNGEEVIMERRKLKASNEQSPDVDPKNTLLSRIVSPYLINPKVLDSSISSSLRIRNRVMALKCRAVQGVDQKLRISNIAHYTDEVLRNKVQKGTILHSYMILHTRLGDVASKTVYLFYNYTVGNIYNQILKQSQLLIDYARNTPELDVSININPFKYLNLTYFYECLHDKSYSLPNVVTDLMTRVLLTEYLIVIVVYNYYSQASEYVGNWMHHIRDRFLDYFIINLDDSTINCLLPTDNYELYDDPNLSAIPHRDSSQSILPKHLPLGQSSISTESHTPSLHIINEFSNSTASLCSKRKKKKLKPKLSE